MGRLKGGAGEDFRNFLRGLDKKVLRDSNLTDLIEQSKINITNTNASNILAEDEFLKIRPKRTLDAEDKNKIKKLLKGKTGRLESITYKGTDYYQGSDGRIREKINIKADRPEAYKIKQTKEIEKLNLIKSKDVFPSPGKDVKFQIWKDLYESTKKRTYGPRAGDFESPEPRLKVVTRPNDLTTAAVKDELILLDTKTNKKITFKNLEKYINSLPDTSFKEMSLPYKYKNWLSDQTLNYKGKTDISLRTVLRENLLSENELNNWKASPYQVHHPFGINENPFKVQLAMHKPNRLEGHIRLDTLKQLDKAGTNEKDVKKILNNFKKKIKDIGGIQSGVRDIVVGENLSPENFFKKLVSEAKIGRETRPLLKKLSNELVKGTEILPKTKQIEICNFLSNGGLPGDCKRAITQNPEEASKIISQIEVDSPKAAKVKNAATSLNALFASGQITTADKLPRPDDAKLTDTFKETNLRWNNDVGAFETTNGDIASQADIKKYAADNPMEIKVGEEPVKAATNKSVLANVGKAMARIGAPLPTAALDAYFIGKQVQEGKGTAEIASNPLNWLGLATMEPLTKISGVAEGGGLNKALRLGLNPATIRGISRFAGLPGLAVSTAMTAYDQYQKYKDGEGFIFNLLNQKGTE